MKSSDNPSLSIIGIGAGGHSKVLIEILRRMGTWEIVGLLDADESRRGQTVSGVPILGGDDLVRSLRNDGVVAAFIGIGSVGSTELRRKALDLLQGAGFELPSLVHPFAAVAADAVIGRGACIMPGVIINPGTRIGDCAIINSSAVIEHDCTIAAFAHISPGAILGGNVHVGEGAHIGIGAVVRQGIRIGANAMVGAGAVVVKDVTDAAIVTGIPASPRK